MRKLLFQLRRFASQALLYLPWRDVISSVRFEPEADLSAARNPSSEYSYRAGVSAKR
jgi:hypothetical protein